MSLSAVEQGSSRIAGNCLLVLAFANQGQTGEIMYGSRSKSKTAAVLLVDDEEIVLDEYREFLEFEGIYCATQSLPERASEMVLARPEIRVVVTDLRMPGLDGEELIRLLRSHLPEDRKVRFIVLTGYGANGLRDRLPDVPILDKPVDLSSFLTEVRRALV